MMKLVLPVLLAAFGAWAQAEAPAPTCKDCKVCKAHHEKCKKCKHDSCPECKKHHESCKCAPPKANPPA